MSFVEQRFRRVATQQQPIERQDVHRAELSRQWGRQIESRWRRRSSNDLRLVQARCRKDSPLTVANQSDFDFWLVQTALKRQLDLVGFLKDDRAGAINGHAHAANSQLDTAFEGVAVGIQFLIGLLHVRDNSTRQPRLVVRSEEHTSELQSHSFISYS